MEHLPLIATCALFAVACSLEAPPPSPETLSFKNASPSPVESKVDAASGCGPRASSELLTTNRFGTLSGTLELPSGCGPFPVTLLIPGSGPNDRDGNNSATGAGPNCYALLARGLAARGIASVRYDKAGVGKSAGAFPTRETDFRFEMGGGDAAAFVRRLRADKRFAQVSVIGHSEGALLGMLVSEVEHIDGYVSLAGAGRPIGVVLREQLAGRLQDSVLLEKANALITELEAGRLASEVPKPLEPLFRPSVQPYLISWMKYDPAGEIRNVSTPTLVVQGTTDIQVTVWDASLVATARAGASLTVVAGMNHVLKAATLEARCQRDAYTDPALPVVDELFTVLEAFLRSVN